MRVVSAHSACKGGDIATMLSIPEVFQEYDITNYTSNKIIFIFVII